MERQIRVDDGLRQISLRPILYGLVHDGPFVRERGEVCV